jgi:hypothetical protein
MNKTILKGGEGMKWNKIENPPQYSGQYLVASWRYRFVGQARFMPKKNQWKFPSAQMAFEPTHWMELPNPPLDNE